MKKLTVLFVALVMVLAALPALAQDKADWAFYGQARMWTAWESMDKDSANYLALAPGLTTLKPGATDAMAWNAGGALGFQDDDELAWKLGGTARIGARVKWGNVGGNFEYRQNENPKGGDFLATTALLNGYWDFGPGRLVVGKDYPPYFFLISDLCGPGGGECSGVGWGSIYSGRRSQLKLVMGGFQFALVEPSVRATNAAGTVSVPALVYDVAGGTGTGGFLSPNDTDQWIPSIHASYTFNLGPAQLYIGGLYNSVSYEWVSAGQIKDQNIDSWVFGAAAKTAFGPFYVNGTFQYGQNIAGGMVPANAIVPKFQFVDSTNNYNDKDSSYMSGFLVLGFNLTNTFKLEGGVSWQSGEADLPDSAGGTLEQDVWMYYISATWSPAKNVFIVPELGIIDAGSLKSTGDSDLDLGGMWWLGIKWQINF
jgi:hypothetical protein